MKKRRYIAILFIVFILTGCSKSQEMVNFIPTAMPTQGVDETFSTDESDVTPTPKPIVVGETTTMYVKLSEYNDVLNVRSAPSTSSDAVGFLVHTEKVDVIEIVDGWASFVYNNEICYVNASFLVDEKPDYIDPPTPTTAPKSNQKATTNSDI